MPLIGAGGGGLADDAVDAVEVAEEIASAVARRREAVVGPGERRARDRLDEIGRDDDDELGLVALEVAAAEERAENRQLLQAGEAADRLTHAVLEQAAEDHRAAGGQLERRFGAAHLEAGNRDAGETGGAFRRKLRDLGLDVQADASLREDDRA